MRDTFLGVGLALIAFALGHQLGFLLAYGSDADGVLRSTGHGVQWLLTATSVALLAAVMALAAIRRLVGLRRLASVAAADPAVLPLAGVREFLREAGGLWAVTLPLAAALFAVNENLERLGAGLPLPGISVLWTEGPSFAAIFALVSLAVALVAAMYRWRRDLLLARLRRRVCRWVRPASTPHRPPEAAGPFGSSLVPTLRGRAPPSVAGI